VSRTSAELRDATPDELTRLIADARRSLLDLRFQNASGELENTASLREARRELARALTIARERQADGAAAPAAAVAEPEGDAPADEAKEEAEE